MILFSRRKKKIREILDSKKNLKPKKKNRGKGRRIREKRKEKRDRK